MRIFFIITCAFLTVCDSAKILGIIPTASYSHQIPFRPIWRELSLRGHEVTAITTDPVKNKTLSNLTEIDISFVYKIYEKYDVMGFISDETKSFMDIARHLSAMFNETFDKILTSPEVERLLYDENINFDLVILEAQYPMTLGFSWKFKCPFIGVASLDAAMQFHDSAGNPTHPIVNPDNNVPTESADSLSFKERLISVIYNLVYKYRINNIYYPNQRQNMKKYFGDDLPPFEEIQNNMSMLFVSTNPILNNIRPLNPNTIEIGSGLHIEPPKPLPKELKSFLDNANEGVIYFSLGSNVKSNILNETVRSRIFGAFSELPYKVLFKFNDQFDNVPKNVRVEKWLPQQDILRHPNIKLFITQGGLQSLQESLINGVPAIGVPFFGDQTSNVNRMVKRGFGLKINRLQLTDKEHFKSTIIEVITNPKYKENAVKYGKLLLDQPATSLDTALWWIEYVIRHKDVSHLRSPTVGMPFWMYYMLDVIAFMFGFSCTLTYLFSKLWKFLFRRRYLHL